MITVSSFGKVVAIAGVVAAMVGVSAVAQTTEKAQAQKVTVTLTKVPSAPPGENSFGDIAGVVKNAPAGSKVVLYSFGDTWYVQPYANAPFTEIGKDGKFSATIHGGYKFAALVVKSGYQPEATTGDLPKVGGNVLAVTTAPQRKP